MTNLACALRYGSAIALGVIVWLVIHEVAAGADLLNRLELPFAALYFLAVSVVFVAIRAERAARAVADWRAGLAVRSRIIDDAAILDGGVAPGFRARGAHERMQRARRPIAARLRFAIDLTVAATLAFTGYCALEAYARRDALSTEFAYFVSRMQPSDPIVLRRGEALLSMDAGGRFVAEARLLGRPTALVVDTGSNFVALPFEVAAAIGVDVDGLDFSRVIDTANGQTRVADIVLGEVAIGPIVLHDVHATVAEQGRLSTALLGMSFLAELSEVSISEGRMRLVR